MAVGSHDGTWTVHNNDGSIAGSDVGVPGYGIAMADTDGDGIDEVHACSEEGCKIIAEDLDGDGQDELIVSGMQVEVNWGAWTQRFDEAGILSTSDVNADGRQDLLVFDDESGTLSVHRGLNGGLAPAWSIRTERDVRGPVFLADVNQDGKPEFLAITEAGKLVHSRTN